MKLKWLIGLVLIEVSILTLTAEKPQSSNSGEIASVPLTLPAAIARSLTDHPELAAHKLSFRVEDARILQAGLGPNPKLFVEAENMLGSGAFSGAEQAEITIGISQVFELWGRRKKRMSAIGGGRALARRDYESARLRIAAVTASRFIGVVGARETVQLASEAVRMAEDYHNNLMERAKSGRGSRVEESRSRVDVERARVALVLANRGYETASMNLSAQWGGFFSELVVAGNLEAFEPIPDLTGLQGRVQSHPDILRWAAERERLRHTLAFERVEARSDVELGAGYRWLNGPDDSAFLFAASIPLPVLNRNQGSILEAELSINRAGDMEAAALWAIRADLTRVWNRLKNSKTEVDAIRARLLPAAEEAQKQAMNSHNMARLSYLDVFETRRTHYQIKQRLLGALTEFHLARVELDSLIGTLPGVPTISRQP